MLYSILSSTFYKVLQVLCVLDARTDASYGLGPFLLHVLSIICAFSSTQRLMLCMQISFPMSKTFFISTIILRYDCISLQLSIAKPFARMTATMESAKSRQVSSLAASTSTRTTGSVPLFRNSTRPLLPSLWATSVCAA